MESTSQSNAGAVRAKLEFPVWHRSFMKAYNAWSNAPSDLKTPLLLQGPALAKAESWLLICPEKLTESQKRFIVRSISQRARGPGDMPVPVTVATGPKRGKWRRASDRGLWSLYAVIGVGLWLFSPDIIRDGLERALNSAEVYESIQAEKKQQGKTAAKGALPAGETQAGEAPSEEAKNLEVAAPLGDIDETPPIYMPATPMMSPAAQKAELAREQLEAGKMRQALLIAIEAGEAALAEEPADMETAGRAAAVVSRAIVVRETLGPLAVRSATARTTMFCDGAGALIAIAGDQQLAVWPAGGTRRAGSLVPRAAKLEGAGVDRECRRALVPNEDFNVEIRQLAGGRLTVELHGHEADILASAFSPDGSAVVTASQDSTARIWDARTGRQRAFLSGHDWHVVSAEFSPDGKRVLTASSDKTARIWDAATGRQIHELKGHQGVVTSARFSEDGTRVLTTSWDGFARVWDAATGAPLLALLRPDGIMMAVASPDASRIVSSLADGGLHLWDGLTGQLIESWAGSGSGARDIRFAQGGRLAVIHSWNGQVDLYDVSAAKLMRTLAAPELRVRGVEIARGARAVVAVTEEGTRLTWPLLETPQEAFAEGKAVAPGCLDANERSLLGLEGGLPAWCALVKPREAALP